MCGDFAEGLELAVGRPRQVTRDEDPGATQLVELCDSEMTPAEEAEHDARERDRQVRPAGIRRAVAVTVGMAVRCYNFLMRRAGRTIAAILIALACDPGVIRASATDLLAPLQHERVEAQRVSSRAEFATETRTTRLASDRRSERTASSAATLVAFRLAHAPARTASPIAARPASIESATLTPVLGRAPPV
jgi:hypothetical protein